MIVATTTTVFWTTEGVEMGEAGPTILVGVGTFGRVRGAVRDGSADAMGRADTTEKTAGGMGRLVGTASPSR